MPIDVLVPSTKSAAIRRTSPQARRILAIDAIRQCTCWIRGERIGEAHDHHHAGNPCDVQSCLLGAQHEERFAEASQRESSTDRDHKPVAAGEFGQCSPVQRGSEAARRARMDRLFDAKEDQADRNECRHDRKPQDGADMIGEPERPYDGDERAGKRTDCVHRLPKAEAGTADFRWSDIGDECITRGAADTLADAIEQTCGHDDRGRACKREKRLGERCQPVAEQQ